MPAYITIVSGAAAKFLRFEAAGSFLAGRAPDCAFVLNDAEVSRHHCRFDWDGTTCTVEDLSSRRGTLWNGAPLVAKAALKPGDKLSIASLVLEFGMGEPPSTSSVQPKPSGTAAGIPVLVAGKETDHIEPNPKTELAIGRDPQCDVVLNHPGVSRRHASLRIVGGGCVVTDLQSSAGSFVNGHRFDSHELTVGDRLQIGPFDFQYDGKSLVRIAAARGSSIRVMNLDQGDLQHLRLDDLTFTISSSRFTGILGPSGAGKSTLLHALAGLHAPLRGKVLVDGEDIYATDTPRAFGLVPQEDIVHRELKVAEALRFSARLRLPAATPSIEIQKLILQTMDQLGLRPHADKPVARLSGGQRKRVSVAVELLARPAVLFLDEPSSGLDPATESQLMEVLRELTNTGCTVVCTTHVMENAYLMDELIIISGGCLAFLGTAQEAREYFGVNRLHALYERLLERPAVEWKQEFAAKRPPAEPQEPRAPATEWKPRKRALALPILLARQWAILASDWRNFVILGGQPLIIALLVAWVCSPKGDDKPDASLALFFGYLATLWFGCSNAAQAIVKEIPIYRRERLIGVSARSYLASKYIFLFAITAAQAFVLYGCLRMSLAVDGAASLHLGALLGVALSSVGIGCAISALARSMMQAVLIVPLILIPQILFSGHPVKAYEMKDPVYAVAFPMPTFASQTMVDVSFFWNQKVGGEISTDHYASLHNLQRNKLIAAADLRNGSYFTNGRPALVGLVTHLLWAVITFCVAYLGLRRQERKKG